jgi:hypothetical protein
MVTAPAAAVVDVAAVVDDVELAPGAGAAAELELELDELPHAASTIVHAASAATPETRNLAVLRLAIMALPVSDFVQARRIRWVNCEDPGTGRFLPFR